MRTRRPLDPVTFAEAAHILGCTPSTIRRHVIAGRLKAHRRPHKHRTLSRADVEALATRTYRYRRHIHDPESYWVTNERAAAILGVNRARLNQLAAKDFIPFVVHQDGTRLYRRRQLEVVGNAREARWVGLHLETQCFWPVNCSVRTSAPPPGCEPRQLVSYRVMSPVMG